MIIDDLNNNDHIQGNHSLPQNIYLKQIINSIKNTNEGFRSAINSVKKRNLNEDDLTQIFVKQNTIQLQKLGLNFLYVGVQYRDLSYGTKGIPDIYYSFIEQDIENEPVFLIEAKRVPAPTNSREKEYVTGQSKTGNPTGGIERFKLEKHGLGLNECGLLGYIHSQDYSYWFSKINNWINELSRENNLWKTDELLKNLEGNYCISYVNRKSDRLKLHHFWIDINPTSE